MKLSPENHILFYKVFFDKNCSKPPEANIYDSKFLSLTLPPPLFQNIWVRSCSSCRLVDFVTCSVVKILLLYSRLFTNSLLRFFDALPCISMRFCNYEWCFIFLIFFSWFAGFLFSGILLRIFVRSFGMLLLQDVLLISFNVYYCYYYYYYYYYY